MRVNLSRQMDKRLATYLSAAGAIGATMASEAEAVLVGSTTNQSFGVNGVVSIDFNSDTQIDFQIDHDRVEVTPGSFVDYLQIDKADINSETNPLPFDTDITNFFVLQAQNFPVNSSPGPNDANNSAYVITNPQLGSYPAALPDNTAIGPLSIFDFQENDNFLLGTGDWIRANRLIDEDNTQIDQVIGGRNPADIQAPFGTPGFVGLGGQVRYLGLRMELNGTGQLNYGWVGIRIDNEGDATGEVTGWAYETTPGAPIRAGQIPEPASIITALMGGLFAGCFLWRRLFRR